MGRKCFLFVLFWGIPFIQATASESRSPLDNTFSATQSVYSTEFGMGPDKWASAWLIRRKLHKNSTISVYEAKKDAPQDNVVLFDVPGTPLYRDHNLSTFEIILRDKNLITPLLVEMAQVINDIEIKLWRANSHPQSTFVEEGFRHLQRSFQGEVSVDCYVAFFDNVYEHLGHIHEYSSPDELVPNSQCQGRALATTLSQTAIVPEITKVKLLGLIEQGQNVMFVDVREANEFFENHIPGAVNIAIRDIDDNIVAALKEQDLVITYCVKDFRGFEMAKILRDKGLDNTAIMKPYGIKGWIEANLPIYKRDEFTEKQAVEALMKCAANNCGE